MSETRDRVGAIVAALLMCNTISLRLGKRAETEAIIRKAIEIDNDIRDRIDIIEGVKK